MGGNILLRNARLPGSWFQRMVLSAPMIAIAPQQLGLPAGAVRAYTELLSALGLGWLYVRHGGNEVLEATPFEENPVTSDRERFLRSRMVLETAPTLGLGSPTIGWLRAALRSIAKINAPDYPLRVELPLLLFAAGADRIVSTQAIEEFGLRLKVGTHVLIPQAKHEILQETDNVRSHFWAVFDEYLGVTTAVA
jgi:lysophospholipase